MKLIIVLVLAVSIVSLLNMIINTDFRNEGFYDLKKNRDLFEDMMKTHYQLIFPNNGNRNAAGFKFFEYIYDNLAKDIDLFDRYNKLYCGVSGSIVHPEDPSAPFRTYSIVRVRDINNKCVFGKYYRCCTPCNCDIMKYTRIIRVYLEIPKGSGKFYDRNLITIGDPCLDEHRFPAEIDRSVFTCSEKHLKFGYRVDSNNRLTKGPGRLIIAVLFDLDNEEQKKETENTVDMCVTGTKRLLSPPDKLRYGMGDIFVKLSLINNSDNYKNSKEDLCI
jgi:hypothetical protein